MEFLIAPFPDHCLLVPFCCIAIPLQIIYICRNPKASVPSLYKVLKYINEPPAASLREYFELFLKGYEGGRIFEEKKVLEIKYKYSQ